MADCSVEEAGFDISALKTSLIQYFRCQSRERERERERDYATLHCCSLPPLISQLLQAGAYAAPSNRNLCESRRLQFLLLPPKLRQTPLNSTPEDNNHTLLFVTVPLCNTAHLYLMSSLVKTLWVNL
ncbi:hypothetical protein JOB18_026118 [Solea senegalensis]|uniref:Uncharacterized protein n=1 Tax=Solea senegalensis TaxID=28829 RepID=A0AAV6QWV1_SOLSE|nr:hypothetical protein JOB18_026118 [Solea senegalensis]